MVNGVAAERWV